MSVELQNIDTNCNNCKFMTRDSEKFQKSFNDHNRWQLDYFNVLKSKLKQRAEYFKTRFYDLLKWNDLHQQADNMKFQFDKKECYINYGYCEKLKKDVSFIPNICMPNNQECFENRKI